MSSQGKKSRKHGRSKRNGQSAAYRAEGRRNKHKAARVLSHFAEHPHDRVAYDALKILGGAIGKTIAPTSFQTKPKNTKPGYLKWLKNECGFRKGGKPNAMPVAA